MANEVIEYSGQILGVDVASSETRKIKTDNDGHLQTDVLSIPSIPAGTNKIGIITIESQVSDVSLLDGIFAISGTSIASTNLGVYKEALFMLNVTAASGTTPTLDVVLEASVDGTNWFTLENFTQKTAISFEVKRITNFGSRLRAKYTISGTTPSFTVSLKGTFKS